MTFFIRKLGPLNETILFSFRESKFLVLVLVFSFILFVLQNTFSFCLLRRGDIWLKVRRARLFYIIWKGVFLVSLFCLIVIMFRMVFISFLSSFILNMSS